MHHTIKIFSDLYPRVKSGEKRFEIRKDDRNYQCGDTVSLICFDPKTNTENELDALDFRIGFVLRGGQYGLEPGYVAFQLEPLEPELPDCDDPSRPFGGINRIAPDNWAAHDGSNVPNRVRGVTAVEVRYRDGTEELLTGPAVMPEIAWKWCRPGMDHLPGDIVAYRIV